MEKREPAYIVGGNVNWQSHYVKQYGGASKNKLKIELLHDGAIPLLGIHRQNYHLKDTCTPVFTAALFIRAETQRQPRCPSRDEQKGDTVHIHNGILLSR